MNALHTRDRETQPSPHAWFVLFLFTLSFALSYVDRQVLTVLVEPIRHEFALSDTQIGLLQGLAFALFYTTAAVPLGWLVDNTNRIRVAATCIAVWSVATASCGVVTSYFQLIFARAGTAAAEAGCSPAALSVMADIFPARLVPRASAIYLLAPYVGGGIALAAGSYLLQYFTTVGGLNLPFAGHFAPWQAVFVVIGLPGLLLSALMWLTIGEPVRIEGKGVAAADRAISFRETVRYIVKDSSYLVLYFSAFIFVLTTFFTLLSWFPTFVIREVGGAANAASSGRILGGIFMIFGSLGTLATSVITRHLADDKVLPYVLRVMLIAVIVQIPLVIALSLTFSPFASYMLYAAEIFCISLLSALMPIPMLQASVPNRMRGKIIGIFLLTVNLIGSSVGPALVGRLSDVFKSAPHPLATGLLIVLVFSTITAALLLFLTLRRISVQAVLPHLPSASVSA